MERSLSLDELADRTRIEVRRLRYVLDQGLLPGAQTPGRGIPRSLLPDECLAIVLAALMLRAGLRRALVRDCMEVVCREGPDRFRDSAPLHRALVAGRAAWLEVGDGQYVRVSGSGPRPAEKQSFDTGWRPLAGVTAPAASYQPLVAVRIDVLQARRMFQG